MDKPKTYEPALEGVYGLFVTRAFGSTSVLTRRWEQAKMIVKAGEKAGVSHYIWSTLEDTIAFFGAVTEDQPPKIKDEFYVPHFDPKGQIRSRSSILPSTWRTFGTLAMVKDGTMCNNMGDVPLPTICAEDSIGKSAYGIFMGGLDGKYIGESVYVAGNSLTCTRMMDIASEVTDKTFKSVSPSTEPLNMPALDSPAPYDLC
eukprot:scaffold7011_cov56-Cyclotella_meneghiniana.AAC.1